MKISSIVDITNGKLRSIPAISFITQIHTDIKKINDGDLFISSNKDEINIAVEKGAFAIVYDCSLNINTINKEIAYINVECIKSACIKLLRYKLINKNIKSLIVDNVSFELFCICKPTNDYLYLSDDIFENFENIQNKNNINTIISNNEDFLKSIYTKSIVFKVLENDIKNLIVHSLFETSFSFNNIYYTRLKLPLIYIDNFISVICFLNLSNIDISRLKAFRYMQGIFINKSNQIVEYGKSNKFIISNSSKSTNELEIEFLKKFYSYGKIIILDENIINDNEILIHIQKQNYNALYIKSKTKQETINILNKNQTISKSLF